MKTTIKQLAAGTFIALLLVAGNVNAKSFKIAALSHENIETSLQLEKWMVDDNLREINSLNITEVNRETDLEMEIESWMTNTEAWVPNLAIVQAANLELNLESWMMSAERWNGTNNNEIALTVEKQ